MTHPLPSCPRTNNLRQPIGLTANISEHGADKQPKHLAVFAATSRDPLDEAGLTLVVAAKAKVRVEREEIDNAIPKTGMATS